MRWKTTLLGLFMYTGALAASAQTFNSGPGQVTLLELYTSQGCSSCPPAERYLNTLTGHDDLWTRLVPLAFHVDYWDYIGWRDPYGAPAHGQRQRALAAAAQARTVYTPGFFNNGREWRGWVFRRDPQAIDAEPGNLAVTVDGGRLAAQFAASGGELDLHVAVLGFGISTAVARGENRGRTLPQEFVVLGYRRIPSADGRWEAPLPDYTRQGMQRLALAAWVSPAGQPAPLQATGGWLQ